LKFDKWFRNGSNIPSSDTGGGNTNQQVIQLNNKNVPPGVGIYLTDDSTSQPLLTDDPNICAKTVIKNTGLIKPDLKNHSSIFAYKGWLEVPLINTDPDSKPEAIKTRVIFTQIPVTEGSLDQFVLIRKNRGGSPQGRLQTQHFTDRNFVGSPVYNADGQFAGIYTPPTVSTTDDVISGPRVIESLLNQAKTYQNQKLIEYVQKIEPSAVNGYGYNLAIVTSASFSGAYTPGFIPTPVDKI